MQHDALGLLFLW